MALCHFLDKAEQGVSEIFLSVAQSGIGKEEPSVNLKKSFPIRRVKIAGNWDIPQRVFTKQRFLSYW